MDLLYNMETVLLNRRLTADIGFHNTLHGFQVGRGTWNASLKAKLFQHMTPMREAVFYKISLDIQKSYDALYMDQ